MANFDPQNNPYRSSGHPDFQPKRSPEGIPQVVIWEMIYCGGMVLLYLGLSVLGFFFMQDPGMFADEATPPREIYVMGLVFTIIGIPLTFLFAAGLIWRRGTGGWIFHIVLICIGLTSACCLPTNIPLLIFWIKDKDRIIG